MGRDPASIASLKAYSRDRNGADDGDAILAEVRGQSDRAAVIIMAAHVEDDLEDYIRSKLREDLTSTDAGELFRGDAPLARFSAKIRVAHALGLFGPNTRHDLDLIRAIRNACAHALRPVSFDLEVFSAPVERFRCLAGHVEDVLEGGNTPRNRFARACIMHSVRMWEAQNEPIAKAELDALLP